MRANLHVDILYEAWTSTRAQLRDHESRITALEMTPPARGSPRSSINWRRLLKPIKATFGAISFLVRHWGIIAAGITMAWAFILPTLKWIWRLITGSIAYVVGAGSGV